VVTLMEWFKTYANTPQRPTIQDLSDGAFRLWSDGRCYIALTESDGFIPGKQLSRFGPHGKRRNVVELVGAGVWEAALTGWIDQTWGGEGQLTAARAEEKRKHGAERQRQWRDRNAVTDGVTDGVSNAASHCIDVDLDIDVDVDPAVFGLGRALAPTAFDKKSKAFDLFVAPRVSA
jgi:hypothetical protein